MKFRPDIEGMRAIAVIVVVLYHAGVGAFAGGYLGVDVFFVLSGFLITTLLLDEVASNGRISIIGFYGRRARRLLPASVMVTAATVIVGWFVLNPLARRDLVGDAIATTTYTVNWRFAQSSTDYFQAELAPSALQHYWSLAVEEQFYVVWPLLITILAAGRLRRGRIATGVAIVVGASLVLSIVITRESQPWAFFGLHTRMWQLGAGALFAIAWPLVTRVDAKIRNAAAVVGLVAVVAGVFVFDEATAWPGTAAIIPTLGTIAVLWGTTEGPVARLLSNRPALWIGARSYSWYLWHWPALVLFAAWRDRPNSIAVGLAVSAAALLIGHIGYTMVEHPIRSHVRLVRSPPRSLAIGVSLSALCLIGLIAIRPVSGQVDASGRAVETLPLPPIDGLGALLDEAAQVDDVPRNLQPSLEAARDDLPVVYTNGCHVDVPATKPAPCALGDVDADTTVVLIGDSHAAQWVPALDELATDAGIRFVSMTKSGCAVSDVAISNSILGREYTECAEWRDAVVAEIAEIGPDMVIATQSAQYTSAATGKRLVGAELRDGYAATLTALAESTERVVVLGDTPFPSGDVPECLAANLDAATKCVVDRETGLRFFDAAPVRQAAEAAGADYLDAAALTCGERCPVIVGDLLVYRDASHLATPYVRWLAPALAAQLGAPWDGR